MRNWWEEAPVVEAPKAGRNWWEEAPIVTFEGPKPARAYTAGEAVARGVAQGASFGLSDELGAAAAGSPIPGAQRPGGMPNMNPIDVLTGLIFGDKGTYEQELAAQRAANRAAAEQHPIAYGAGQVAGALPSAVAGGGVVNAGAGLTARLAQSAGVGAGLGAVQGAGEGEGIEGRITGARTGAGMGALFGAGGEAIATAGGALFRRVFGGATAPAEGVDPAARVALAQEFGVPLTRGQATGNVGQQAYEEAARHAARGLPAQKLMERFDARQAQAIQEATEGVSRSLGGAPVAPGEAGEAVAQAVRGRAETLREGANQAYERAAAKEAFIASDEVSRLAQRVTQGLDEAGIVLDTYGNYPGAQAAMNLLRRVSGFEGAPADGQVVAQSLKGIEQARKALIQVKPANAEDRRALGVIRESFDNWISDAMDQKLFSGDASALDDLLEARSLWSQYKGLTAAKKGDAPKLISKIATENKNGDEVANWLLGSATVGQAGRSARTAIELRRILGKDSAEWQALRQAAWQKVLHPSRGEGPRAVVSSIEKFISGEGAPLSRALFDQNELAQIRKLANVIKFTIANPKATNPSKTGYEMARLLGIGTGGAVATGGVGASWLTGDPKYLAIAALPLLRNAQSVSKGIAATRALPGATGQAVGRTVRALPLTGPALAAGD